MYTYELRCFNEKLGCFRVDHIGSERDALAKFHRYKENTIKAHEALDDAGLPTDCLADVIQLVMYDDQDDWKFADMAGWQLTRNSDGMIIGGRYA
jgi:hypothetical protein